MLVFKATARGELHGDGLSMRCAIGKGGFKPAADKREGDGASPIGAWPIRRVLYRQDRVSAPNTRIPTFPIAPNDGWCDAPDDPNYNRPVTLPYPASAETLWRDDNVYDIIVILGHNDDPVVPGAGSAIFWHLARPDYAPTEGCVAVAEADMRAALARAKPGDVLEISAD